MWHWNRKANRFYLVLLVAYLAASTFFEANIPIRLAIVTGFSTLTLLMTN